MVRLLWLEIQLKSELERNEGEERAILLAMMQSFRRPVAWHLLGSGHWCQGCWEPPRGTNGNVKVTSGDVKVTGGDVKVPGGDVKVTGGDVSATGRMMDVEIAISAELEGRS